MPGDTDVYVILPPPSILGLRIWSCNEWEMMTSHGI
jgi:hypothetical protein